MMPLYGYTTLYNMVFYEIHVYEQNTLFTLIKWNKKYSI